MKKTVLPLLILGFMGILMLPTACKKSSDDTTPQPTSKMNGTWQGISGQDTIRIKIEQPGGSLMVTLYHYAINRGSVTFSETKSQSTGIAPVSNLAFNIALGTGHEGPAYLSGTFNSSQDTLNGIYAIYPLSDTLTRYTGNYQALKIQ
jgi:hypothetical protein